MKIKSTSINAQFNHCVTSKLNEKEEIPSKTSDSTQALTKRELLKYN